MLPNYQPTQSSWSTTPSVDSEMGEYPSDTPHMINMSPFQKTNQRLPEQVIRAHFPSMAREEPSFRHRVGIISSLFKEEDRTSTECHTGSSTVSGKVTSHRTRPSSNVLQSSPESCIISPVPSLFRARARALTIASTSGLSRLGGTDGDRNQVVHGDRRSNGDGRRDCRSYESPFSRRIKEKLREAHVSNSEGSGGPGNQAVGLLAPDEDADRHGSPELLGADLISCHINIVVGTDWLSMAECLSHLQGPSNIRDTASPLASCTNLPVIKPLHVRTAKPRVLMGPRNLNVATSPGSVMDRVRMIEGRHMTGRRDQI